jgi:hypothetical protein
MAASPFEYRDRAWISFVISIDKNKGKSKCRVCKRIAIMVLLDK